MNATDRKNLREKHHVGQNEGDDQCQSCYSADGYPCDAIRLLDELDAIALITTNWLTNTAKPSAQFLLDIIARLDGLTHVARFHADTQHYHGKINEAKEALRQ